MSFRKRLLPAADWVLAPLAYLAARVLRSVRVRGVNRFPRTRAVLIRAGVFPIVDHYYEPQFDYRDLATPLADERHLPGIDLNVAGQLATLAQLTRSHELADWPRTQADAEARSYHLDNGSFASGDAEVWYQMIRSLRPRRIIEIGSGHSTLIAASALRQNATEDADYTCAHVCVEPYEMPWLESTGVEVVRQRVEELPLEFFASLQAGDILFVDSSHVIRPQGDVLFEVLEILPSLAVGVVVHVHDIFTPRNYLSAWLVDEVKFWNEQYLLEAFLTHNANWRIIGALNYLHHHHAEELLRVAPFLTPDREPGSLYIERVA